MSFSAAPYKSGGPILKQEKTKTILARGMPLINRTSLQMGCYPPDRKFIGGAKKLVSATGLLKYLRLTYSDPPTQFHTWDSIYVRDIQGGGNYTRHKFCLHPGTQPKFEISKEKFQ